MFVSSDEFWDFSQDLTEKITRKKIKSQYNQCTYSDLDFLLRNSNAFSLNSFVKPHLYLLSQILVVCSSTLIYLTLSSLLVSTYITYLRIQLTSSILTSPVVLNASLSTVNNRSDLVLNNQRKNETDNLDVQSENEAQQKQIFSIIVHSENETFSGGSLQPYCHFINDKLVNFGVQLYKMLDLQNADNKRLVNTIRNDGIKMHKDTFFDSLKLSNNQNFLASFS